MSVTYVKYTTKLMIVATTECLNNIAKGTMDPKVDFSHQNNFITSCPKSHCAKNFISAIQCDECMNVRNKRHAQDHVVPNCDRECAQSHSSFESTHTSQMCDKTADLGCKYFKMPFDLDS